MKNENWIRNRLEAIESQVYLIKILLLILILICLSAFFGFSSIMGELGAMFRLPLSIGIIIASIYLLLHLIVYLLSKIPMRKMDPIIEKKLQEIVDKAKSEQEQQP